MRLTFVGPLVATVCAVFVGGARSAAAAQSDSSSICVAMARSEMGTGVDLSAPLRNALVEGLSAVHVRTLALNSGDQTSALTEAASKGCAYMLMTRVRSGGSGGLMQRMSNMKRMTGGLPQSASADTGSAGSPPQTLATAEQSGIRRGDTVSLEYRLLPSGSVNPTKSDKFEVKAQADGEDVLTPLVARLSSAVSGAGIASADARRGEAQAQASSASSEKRRRGKESSPQNAAPTSTMDCDQIAAASHGTVSLASCKQMMGLQQTYNAASADPAASRPGDDQMTCDQIVAEMKQQNVTAPDRAKAAEAQAAMTDLQQTMAKQQKEVTELVAKESAEMAAASRLAMVSNAAAAKAEEKVMAEQKAANERMAKESAPKAERAIDANAALASDIGQQVAANPRLVKLVQLASQKSCKVQ